MWYLRLGHIIENKITKLVEHGIIDALGSKLELTCESCILKKMIKSIFMGQGEKATELLGLIHFNVCGSINVMVQGGYV